MRTKLKSERGASLTYALLCFLVCAVIGSVVLSSATTATGRFAGIGEADRRYYAVTSAARLMEEAFKDKKTVLIEMEKRFKRETTREEDAITSKPLESDVEYELKRITSDETDTLDPVGDSLTGGELNIFQYAAYRYIIGSTVSPTIDESTWENPAYKRDGFKGCEAFPEMTLSFKDEESAEKLKLKLNGEMEENGSLILRFSNDDETDTYTLRMTMTPDVVPADNVNVVSTRSTVGADSSETLTEEITETKTYTVIWRVLTIDMERGVSVT